MVLINFFRKYFAPLLLVAFAFTFIACQQGAKNGNQADNYTYKVPGQATWKLVGFCSTDVKSFSCWDPSGASDSTLSERANAYFLSDPNAMLQLRFNEPSLLVVTETTGSPSDGNSHYPTWTDERGLPLTPAGRTGYSPSPMNFTQSNFPQFSYYWLYPERDQKADNLYLNLGGSFTFPDELPLRLGSSTESNGKSITITGITPITITIPLPQNSQLQSKSHNTTQMKTWRIDYRRSDFPDMIANSIYAMVTDLDGSKNIVVDNNGKPIVRGSSQFPYPGQNRSYVPRSEDTKSTRTGSFSIQTDPKFVKSLLISYGTTNKFEFLNVALQPGH